MRLDPLKAQLLSIGGVLRELRLAGCFTQRLTAEITGVPVRDISKIENGHTDVSFNNLVKLASWFGLHITFKVVSR